MIPRTQNSIRVIMPYKWNGLWVFDDAATGLDKEAFVAGIDDMLDLMTASIPNAERGFVCLFSDVAFPNHQLVLRRKRKRKNDAGTWYHCDQLGFEGWLCPALFRYFETAPKHIYAAFRPKGREKTKQQKTITI